MTSTPTVNPADPLWFPLPEGGYEVRYRRGRWWGWWAVVFATPKVLASYPVSQPRWARQKIRAGHRAVVDYWGKEHKRQREYSAWIPG